MKQIIMSVAIVIFGSTASAHDEGHGPKLSDTGKFGGIVSGVVLKADADKGEKAELLYKAELARGSDGTVRIYLYDLKMKQLEMNAFEVKGQAMLAAKVKGKYKNTSFPLERNGSSFIGKTPKPEGKPYNIDVTISEKGRELLSAFDNLD